MNKTNYKQSTVGIIVNKLRITILIILIINLNISPAYSLSQVDMEMDDSFTSITIDDTKLDLSWLHGQGYNGTGVRVGIMDNGVDFLHEAFSNVEFVEKSFDTPEQESTQTHGTPVSGVIVGYEGINGSAPGSTIISAEMGSNPQDTRLFGNFTAAMEWFVQQNVTIINMSFGGIEDWSSLIEIARQNNIILVGSAGTDGENYPPSGPGAELYSIGVGAVNELDHVAYYSSKGPTYNYYQKPDVVAPGTVESINIISGTGTYTGTSFSTPIITGGIASVISGLNQLSIPWTVGGVKAALINSSTQVTGDYRSQGAGQVNFTKMFLELSSGNPSGNIVGANIIDEFKEIPIGFKEILPLQVVGSGSMVVSFTGNISTIFELNPITTQTALPININTELAMWRNSWLYTYLPIDHLK